MVVTHASAFSSATYARRDVPRRRPRAVTGSIPGPTVAALVLGACAAAVIAAQAPAVLALDPGLVAVLVASVVLAEAGGFELFRRSSYSISVVPILAAGMLLGVSGAVVVAPAAAVARGLRRRSRWYKVVFNAGAYTLAGAGAAAAFGALGAPLTIDRLPRLLVAAAAAGAVFYLHTGLIAAGLATELPASPTRLWAEQFRWLWPQYLVLGAVALLCALAYREGTAAGAAAFLLPPLLLIHVVRAHVDRMVEHGRELRALNERLEAEAAQRRAAEAENARLAAEAARVAALEELSRLKSEFISIASHELRTPATTILGFAELALEQTSEEDPRRPLLAMVRDDADELARLLGNLLDASRIDSGKMTVDPVPTEVETLLAPLLRTFRVSAPQHAFEARLAPEAQWVLADPDKLRQVLVNLLSNAVKYSPDGGPVLVTAELDGPGRVVLAVADRGVGIPPEHLERIFDPFQRVDSSETRAVRGTGLGLFIVRQLVELHGGRILVESTAGAGSTFRVTFPAAPQKESMA